MTFTQVGLDEQGKPVHVEYTANFGSTAIAWSDPNLLIDEVKAAGREISRRARFWPRHRTATSGSGTRCSMLPKTYPVPRGVAPPQTGEVLVFRTIRRSPAEFGNILNQGARRWH
jgi:hypothetical protein